MLMPRAVHGYRCNAITNCLANNNGLLASIFTQTSLVQGEHDLVYMITRQR